MKKSKIALSGLIAAALLIVGTPRLLHWVAEKNIEGYKGRGSRICRG